VTHFNPGGPQIISDVIRFNALRIDASGQVKYPDSLVFYSDIDADATNLADRGLAHSAAWQHSANGGNFARRRFPLRAERYSAGLHSRVLREYLIEGNADVPLPEASTLLLLGPGLLGLAGVAVRAQRRK